MAGSSDTEIKQKLAQLTDEHEKLLFQFKSALHRDELNLGSGKTERLLSELVRLLAQEHRYVAELKIRGIEGADDIRWSRKPSGRRPVRELVLDVLDELRVPAQPRLTSEYTAARYFLSIPPGRMASLRRDEERAYEKDPQSRPAWVVPALNAYTQRAIRGFLTSSAWESERRVIASRTLRVNHLKTLLALLSEIEEQASESARTRLFSLALRFAESVPGAIEPGQTPEVATIRKAAEGELSRIEGGDLDERREAASRLNRLEEKWRLWGAPDVLEGGAEAVSGR
jgi:hypothetical protein